MREFLSELIKKDIHINLVKGELSVKFPKNGIDKTILEEIKFRKQAIIDYLNNLNGNEFVFIPALANADHYSISDAQRRLWILSQVGGSAAYNIPGTTYLSQGIDIPSFKRAINAAIERHEALRTVFRTDETGEIRQWVLKKEDLGFKIDYKDFRKEENKEEKVKNYIDEDSFRLFDLENGPLLRAGLLQVEDEEYVFYFNMHHIISDGWSMEVLSHDVLSYYMSYKENKDPELKELRIHYKDYSAWQLAQLSEESFKSHRTFWLNSLEGELPLLDLPRRKQRPAIKTYNGHGLSTYICSDTTGKLKKYSHENGGSLFIGLLAAWNVLMYRYTSQRDIIIGTPIAGREHPDLEDQIGIYLNTLAFRNHINPNQSFASFYKEVKESTLASYIHQAYPFDRLVDELNLIRDVSRSPVFDILLDFHSTAEKIENIELNEKEINSISDSGKHLAKYDLEVKFTEVGGFISLQVKFNEDVYEKQMVEGLIKHYKNLIAHLIDNSNESLERIEFLLTEEKDQLTMEFNDTVVYHPKNKTIINLFEEQVEKSPDHVAIKSEKSELTYKELDELSNQLADCLIKRYGVKANDLVGIKLDKGEWAVISMLGVLKTGAAYIPIEPEYTVSRRQHILSESKMELLITNANHLFDEEEFSGSVFAVDVEFEKMDYSKERINQIISPASLAYVIYTSGSTGTPKGVMVEHDALLNYLTWGLSTYANGTSGTLDFGLFTSLSFDLTVTSIYLPLISGGKISIFDSTSDASSILRTYFQSDIKCIKLTPAHISLLRGFDINNTAIQVAIVGGDKLDNAHVEILRGLNPKIHIYNEYGPTESTVGCIAKKVLSEREDIQIGKPISNTRIYILNEAAELQPLGVTGEICIGGIALARGYLKQEELTREKFIANPFKEGERLYKSGDLGRWLPDGNIEFFGRKDDQVKIRGYRIELGEIEQALKSHQSIKEVVVLTKENSEEEKELIAYFTATEAQHTVKLIGYLKKILPEYMLPSHYVQLEMFPLTSNGKINRKSLPDPQGMSLASGTEYVAPRNELEEKLVKIWEEILKKDNIGVKDDFFVLGGNSIKAMKVIASIQNILKHKIEIQKIFANTNIENICLEIENTEWINGNNDTTNEVKKIII